MYPIGTARYSVNRKSSARPIDLISNRVVQERNANGMGNSPMPSSRRNGPKPVYRPGRIGPQASTPIIVRLSELADRPRPKMKAVRTHAASPCPNRTNTNPNSLCRSAGHAYFPPFRIPAKGGSATSPTAPAFSRFRTKNRLRPPVIPDSPAILFRLTFRKRLARRKNRFEINSLSLAVHSQLRHERYERTEIHPRQRRPGT